MEKHNPLFSIIIPTYNRPELLQRAIESVINQKYVSWECIIVDDGSDDHRVRMMCNEIKDQRVQYHYQAKKERSVARNTGIDFATGSYICFLDDDDEYDEDYLADFHTYLHKNNYPDTILRTGYITRTINKVEEVINHKSTNFKESLHKNPVQFAAYRMVGVWSLCIPAGYLSEDRFPPMFPHWQDTHLILRLLAKHPFVQLSNHNYIYHQHNAMGSQKSFDSDNIIARTELNIAAIDDLFENYGPVINPFLPENTHGYLRTEKYMRNASVAAKKGQKNIAWQLLKKGKSEKRLWKSYVRIMKEIIIG